MEEKRHHARTSETRQFLKGNLYQTEDAILGSIHEEIITAKTIYLTSCCVMKHPLNSSVLRSGSAAFLGGGFNSIQVAFFIRYVG